MLATVAVFFLLSSLLDFSTTAQRFNVPIEEERLIDIIIYEKAKKKDHASFEIEEEIIKWTTIGLLILTILALIALGFFEVKECRENAKIGFKLSKKSSLLMSFEPSLKLTSMKSNDQGSRERTLNSKYCSAETLDSKTLNSKTLDSKNLGSKTLDSKTKTSGSNEKSTEKNSIQA